VKSEAVLVRKLAVGGIVSLLLLAGCGGGTSPSSITQPTSSGSTTTPTITTISPNSTVAGGAAFTLTINGTNFVAASMVNFGGSTPATTFLSSTQLTAAIPAASIASTGTPAVTVTNPAPGGGTSKAINFTITSGTITSGSGPTIQVLFPSCIPAGEPSFQLQVAAGSSFVTGSVVRWNGSDRPTTMDAINGLIAQISASDVASAGTAAVTVFNPGPGGGSSNALTFTINSGADYPQSIALDPAGKFAYVASQGCDLDGYVSMYTINPTTGALASIGPPVPTNDEFTDSVTVDPSGKFVYVASSGNVWDIDFGSVVTYTINPTTGALTSTTGGINGTGINGTPEFFNSVAVDPSGKFAYAADGGFFPPGSGGGLSSVSMFTINSTTGALTSTGMIAAGYGPDSVAVDPTGKFAYVTNFESNDVSMHTIDATTGALASIGTTAAGPGPVSVAVDPAGKFAYVANWTGYETNGSVSMYTIDATTGALASTGSIAAGTSPYSVAVDPAGKFAYVANWTGNDTEGSVSMYTIDATTGVLTPSGTIATELSPTSIVIHPSGKFAYVTNSGSNNVSMYSIDSATGTLTLIGTIGT
jgi:6-phosphogluconolactonase (cycloisomerase 2 family)